MEIFYLLIFFNLLVAFFKFRRNSDLLMYLTFLIMFLIAGNYIFGFIVLFFVNSNEKTIEIISNISFLITPILCLIYTSSMPFYVGDDGLSKFEYFKYRKEIKEIKKLDSLKQLFEFGKIINKRKEKYYYTKENFTDELFFWRKNIFPANRIKASTTTPNVSPSFVFILIVIPILLFFILFKRPPFGNLGSLNLNDLLLFVSWDFLILLNILTFILFVYNYLTLISRNHSIFSGCNLIYMCQIHIRI